MTMWIIIFWVSIAFAITTLFYVSGSKTKIVNKKENSENVQIQTDTNAKGQKINVTLAYSSLQSGGRQ